jgi:hypothetical protein
MTLREKILKSISPYSDPNMEDYIFLSIVVTGIVLLGIGIIIFFVSILIDDPILFCVIVIVIGSIVLIHYLVYRWLRYDKGLFSFPIRISINRAQKEDSE